MFFIRRIWKWFFSEPKQAAREQVFSELDDWLARGRAQEDASGTKDCTQEGVQENVVSEHELPVETVFRTDYEQSLPKHRGVEQVLASRKGVHDVLPRGKETSGRACGMKLVVGLGNPGAQYVGTRHNIGYEVLAELGRRHGTGRPRAKFQGELLDASIAGQKVVLLSPVTYMNLSGRSVRPCVDFYKIALSDVLILCDDVNLPIAKLRIRASGTDGGQKGLRDVIRVLGDGVSRLRVGIGERPERMDLADFVLSKFTSEESELIRDAVQRAADAVELWIRSGIERCMDRYN